MAGPALGSTHDGRSGFFLDRPMGYACLALFGFGVAVTTSTIDQTWRHSQNPRLLAYLIEHGSTDLRYVFDVAVEVWLAIGFVRGRRWGLVGLGLLGLTWLGRSLHDVNLFGLFVVSMLLVYPAMRLTGSLGPKPRSQTAEWRCRLDFAAFLFSLGMLGVSLALTVLRIVNGWHQAQDMGTIDFLPFVLSRWWVHLRYLVELGMEVWVLNGVRQNERWAFVLLTLLSASWLVPEIFRPNAFYLLDNGFTLAYPLVRLLGGLGPPPPRVFQPLD